MPPCADTLGEADASVGRMLPAQLAAHESFGVAEEPLPGFATAFEVSPERAARHRRQAIEHQRQVCESHRGSELLGGDRFEVMRLIDDQRLIWPENLTLPLGAREEQRVVADNNGSIRRVAAGAHHEASCGGPVRACGPEAVRDIGRDAAPELLLVS